MQVTVLQVQAKYSEVKYSILLYRLGPQMDWLLELACESLQVQNR